MPLAGSGPSGDTHRRAVTGIVGPPDGERRREGISPVVASSRFTPTWLTSMILKYPNADLKESEQHEPIVHKEAARGALYMDPHDELGAGAEVAAGD